MAIRSDADCRPVIIQNLVQYTPSRNETISTQTPIAADLPPHRGISSRVRSGCVVVCRSRGKDESLFHPRRECERAGRSRMGGGNVKATVAGCRDSGLQNASREVDHA